MDVNAVLFQLIKNDTCFPALKLAWDCQIDVKEIDDLPKITPSHYMKENLLTTEQRHALLCKQQKKISCRKPGVDLVVEPAMVVFQNYKYGDTMNVPITIRNISKTSQKTTLLMDESFVFKFDESSQRVAKFPPGMSMTATIDFRPEDDRDYYHKMVITTNKTRFAIPIIGIGGRGILNAPDSLVFQNVPVKYLKTKNIPVCNLGTKPARFSLSTTGPFCVKPEKGVVPPRATFSMDVSYYSELLGVHDGYLRIKYENGEEVYIYLEAEAVNADIQLKPPMAQGEDTYLGMKTQFMCSIENNSDIILDFKWKKSPFADVVSNSVDKFSEMDLHGGGDTLDKAIDLMQDCEDEGNDCMLAAAGIEEQMRNAPEHLFTHENFLIQPLIGQVQPQSSMNVYIIFSPQEPINHNSTAYLDVTGSEDRIPLELSGKGIGPKFRFGFETMDLGTIFLGGGHSYEIPVLNISEIKGKLEYDCIVGTSSGITMNVEPSQMTLKPDEHGAFYLSFRCTGKPGDFQEELNFLIPKTSEVIHVTVKGTITFPGVHFNAREVIIGQVSYGFPKNHQVPLTNDSLNYVDVCFKMDEDGKDPPISYEKILQSFQQEDFEFDSDPAEFTIEPSSFSLHPRGMQNISLTICANQVRELKRTLICYIADKDGLPVEPFAWLPVNFNCVVPILRSESPEIHLTECYTQFPYATEFLVRNPTDLSACYCVVPQVSSKIRIQSDNLVGVAGPRQVTPIPFKMTCTHVGEATAYFDMYTVGRDEKLFTYCLKVNCIPPKLEPTTKAIDFNDIDVLIPVMQSVEIVNSSPLTMPYVASLIEGGSNGDTWEISPETGIIMPQSTISIEVTVTLHEAGLHAALLHIGMTESLAFIDVKMKANGVGASLKFIPKLEKNDTIDFGAMFIQTEKTFEYEVTNLGHLPKVLDWRHHKDPIPENPPKKENPKAGQQNMPFNKNKPRPPNFFTKQSAFSILPAKKVLQPNTSTIITFSACCKHPSISEADFVLWTYTPVKNSDGGKIHNKSAFSRKSGSEEPYQDSFKPVIVREIKMKAAFESPVLTFSKRSILFRIDATPVQSGFDQRETVKASNPGLLPINVHFKTKFPFQIVLKQDEDGVEEWIHEFQANEVVNLTVSFDGKHLQKDHEGVSFDSKIEAFYIGHTGSEVVALRGEVYFPTLDIDQNVVDFGTIYNGTEAIQEFTVNNSGTFCLTYKWYIKPNTSEIHHAGSVNDQHEKTQDFGIPLELQQSVDKVTANIKEDYAFLTSQFNIFNPNYKDPEALDPGSAEASDLGLIVPVKSGSSEVYGQSSSGKSLDEYGDSVQFLREKIYRTRLLEMVGLHDPSIEAEDEINYLSYNRDKKKAENIISINEIIDIIPMSGIIPAGKSQVFTIAFYGYPDITFKTTAFCFIEGGTGKSVDIQGASTHASVVVVPRSLHLGTILSSEIVTKKVTVSNVGKVAMNVKLNRSSEKQSEFMKYVGSVDIVPTSASILGGGTATFKVSYNAGIIGKFHSVFFVKAQYCGTMKIDIDGESIDKRLSKVKSSPLQTPSMMMQILDKKDGDDKKRDSMATDSAKNHAKSKRRCKDKKIKINESNIEHPKRQTVHPFKDMYCAETDNLEGRSDGGKQKEGKSPCELPSISNSPEVIFSKIMDTVGDDEAVDRVYIRDQDCFDFGPTLVPLRQMDAKKMSTAANVHIPEVPTAIHKLKHEDNVSTFLVKNTSKIPAICTVSLLHERYKYFEFQPSNFTVQSGQEQKVTLWAFPKVPYDLLEDHLVFCVKDNPDAIFFRIRVMGTLPKISMEDDALDFGRSLLNSRSVAQISVTNSGLIPIVWEISNDTPLPEQVFAEKTNGTLKPKETAELRFLFKASRPTLINEHTIDIVFKDTQDILGIIDIFKVAIYGEAYDVLVNIASEKDNFTLIDLGVLPVGYPIIENLVITNRGNYEIMFKFIMDPNNLSAKQKKRMSKYLKDCFLIQPMEDILGPNEACVVQVVFEPPRELNFFNEQILKCQIVDLNMNVLVAELSIPVSVKAENPTGSSGDDRL